MRLLAVALIATIALVTATGCWLEEDETSGSDEDRSELRDYAAAMEIWWLEVNGRWSSGEVSRDVPSNAVDHQRILEDPAAGYYGDNPLPSVEPPLSMETQHKLLVSTVIALAVADADAEVQGFHAGVAAAFCDPRDLGGIYGSGLLWWDVAPLQIWRWGGDPCRARWAGRSRAEGVSADPWRDFQWGCRNYDQLGGFQVSSVELENACANARRWKTAFNTATRVWSAELIRLCGGRAVFLPGPADALAACQ